MADAAPRRQTERPSPARTDVNHPIGRGELCKLDHLARHRAVSEDEVYRVDGVMQFRLVLVAVMAAVLDVIVDVVRRGGRPRLRVARRISHARPRLVPADGSSSPRSQDRTASIA